MSFRSREKESLWAKLKVVWRMSLTNAGARVAINYSAPDFVMIRSRRGRLLVLIQIGDLSHRTREGECQNLPVLPWRHKLI